MSIAHSILPILPCLACSDGRIAGLRDTCLPPILALRCGTFRKHDRACRSPLAGREPDWRKKWSGWDNSCPLGWAQIDSISFPNDLAGASVETEMPFRSSLAASQKLGKTLRLPVRAPSRTECIGTYSVWHRQTVSLACQLLSPALISSCTGWHRMSCHEKRRRRLS